MRGGPFNGDGVRDAGKARSVNAAMVSGLVRLISVGAPVNGYARRSTARHAANALIS